MKQFLEAKNDKSIYHLEKHTQHSFFFMQVITLISFSNLLARKFRRSTPTSGVSNKDSPRPSYDPPGKNALDIRSLSVILDQSWPNEL